MNYTEFDVIVKIDLIEFSYGRFLYTSRDVYKKCAKKIKKIKETSCKKNIQYIIIKDILYINIDYRSQTCDAITSFDR